MRLVVAIVVGVLLLATYVCGQLPVSSLCGSGRCQTRVRVGNETCTSGAEAACVCVDSVLGAPCVECGKQGYIAGGVCVCNLNNQDPDVQCTVPFASNTTVETTRVATVANVTCFFSAQTGWFKTSLNQSEFDYGNENPPVCDECWNDGIGPVPGVLVDDPVLGRLETCATFGSADPNNFNDTSFRTCSGHGVFDFDKVRCECDEPWLLHVTDQPHPELAGVYIPTCSDCQPLWGPLEGTSRCAYISVPDKSGVDAECGGHGAFAGGKCNCYTNSTFGYWNLTTIALNFTVPTYKYATSAETELVDTLFTVQACTELSLIHI